MNSEQDEGQSTSNDNETESRDESEQNWAPRRRRGPRGTRTPLTESEPSPDELNEPAAEANGKILMLNKRRKNTKFNSIHFP